MKTMQQNIIDRDTTIFHQAQEIKALKEELAKQSKTKLVERKDRKTKSEKLIAEMQDKIDYLERNNEIFIDEIKKLQKMLPFAVK